MNQFDIFGKKILQAKTIDRVRVPAADFHEAVVTLGVGEPAYLLGRSPH